MRLTLLLGLALLTGCSNFKLGTVAYCPYGQECRIDVKPPKPAE